MSQRTFAVALMDAPYESENLTTAFRILGAMAQREAQRSTCSPTKALPSLAFTRQAPHARTPVHGKNAAEEKPPHDQGPGHRPAGTCRAERRQGRLGELRHVCRRTRGGRVRRRQAGLSSRFPCVLQKRPTTCSPYPRPSEEDPMAKKTLNIVESAYRGRQRSWKSRTTRFLLAACRDAGRGGAAHRGAARQRGELRSRGSRARQGSPIGGWKQTQAPRMDNDVIDLIEKRKIPVLVI